MRALLAILLTVPPAASYIRSAPGGTPLVRADAAHIEFLVNALVLETIAGDPLAVLNAAAAAWSGIPGTIVRFAPLASTAIGPDFTDGKHVIAFADTPETRAIVGEALAVTVWSYYGDGTLADTDILLNPTVAFSTGGTSGTYDLAGVVGHELGHALGATHSGVLSAAMFQSTLQFSAFNSPEEATMQAQPAADDIAFLVDVYPDPETAPHYQKIDGTIRFTTGAPVRGALITAVNAANGVVIGALSSPTGTYTIADMPPGEYTIFAQSLDGLVMLAALSVAGIGDSDTSFRTAFAAGGGTSITVEFGPPALRLFAVGIGSAGGGDWAAAWTKAIVSGKAWDILLWGEGLDDTITLDQIRLLGPGLAVRPGSLRRQPSAALNGFVPLRLTVDVAPRDTRAVVCIAVTKGSETAANSGGLVILPASH